jgi:hypothetical protein
MNLSELPGSELILPGLDDLHNSKTHTVGALLVAIAVYKVGKSLELRWTMVSRFRLPWVFYVSYALQLPQLHRHQADMFVSLGSQHGVCRYKHVGLPHHPDALKHRLEVQPC